jgi:Zn-dependent metalloprotease
MSRRIFAVSAVTASLLTACYDGGSPAEPEFRLVTADDVDRLGSGELLAIDLDAGPVRFEFSDGLIDFGRITVRAGDGSPAYLQDLLVLHGDRWGVQTAGVELDDGFMLDAKMLAPAVTRVASNTLLWSQAQALARMPRVDLVDAGTDGVPRFIAGDLGTLPAGETRVAARQYLELIGSTFRMGAESDLEPVRSRVGDDGLVHVKFQQWLNDLPVVGGELTVHADAASGQVRAVTGRFVPSDAMPRGPAVDGEDAVRGVALALAADYHSVGVSELVYVVTADGDAARLAWQAEVEYEDADGPQRDIVFADALTGELVARHPQIHYAKSRKTYTAKNQQTLPGTLLISEGGSHSDTVAMAAHNFAGLTYDYYSARHGRDSFNNGGATMSSTVHYGLNYVNAFWDGSRMAYGDGDNNYAGPFAKDPDVVVHELTHAVTQYEAGLVYQNQSGALNEAMSDIMAAAADAWKNGATANTWRLAETCWTPGNASDAMRYMNNPTADGQSYDYYPERYTGGQDNGGVHLNSGIANLAFYLLSQGGKHPRNKTTTDVPAIGWNKADKIFYKALADYLSANATFQDARNATAQAATALFGANSPELTAVHAAWTAVGVPGDPGNGGGGGGGGGGGSCSGTAFNNSLAGSGTSKQEPNGSYYYSGSSGAHTGCLVGPNGADFDLRLYKWNGSAWAQVAKSEGETSTEQINYNGTAGYYTWIVESYSGSGAYTLTLKAP